MKQHEALHLADALAVIAVCPLDFKVARELRRQHELIAELLTLLDEVRKNFTSDDDLPDNLLPRVDAVIAKAQGENE